MLNLSVILADSARSFPDKVAFSYANTDLTFSQVDALASQVANGLRAHGINPGEKVALSCLNLPYFPILYYGILKAGAVVVPLSVLLKKDEIAFHLKDSDAKAYFCFVGTEALPMAQMGHAGFKQAASCERFYLVMPQPEQPATIPGVSTLGELMKDQPTTSEATQTSAEDTAVIVYTSGTTGRPKGAQLTHSNLFLNAMLSADLFQTSEQDTQLIVLPLFHIFAMTCLLNAGVFRGAKSVLLPRFDPAQVFSLMETHHVTLFAGVPTMYWGLLNYSGDDFDFTAIAQRLRVAVSGGASLPVKVLEDFESRFGVMILEGYGMSEGSPVVTFNQPRVGRKPGSIGTPVWGVEVKIVDENDEELPPGEKGELIYRGHNVMKGYYLRPAANAETLRNGWLHSGDVAVKDEDGYFFIVDRTKDMIIRGGLNVYPREVEDVMMRHPAVSLVAVIGVEDEELGEEIKACIVLKEGQSVGADALRDWTKEHIAAYKYPRLVELVDTLPMTATGKILKKELRKQQ